MVQLINSKSTNKICKFLKWDSDFFGFNIGQISKNTMNEHQLSKVINWCNKNKIKCLYFLCESSNPRSNYLAVENQFYPVNIRLTLSIDNIIDNVNTYNTNACVIRPSKDSDIPTLKKIASISYADTRFYYDPNFSNVLCYIKDGLKIVVKVTLRWFWLLN